MHFIATQKENGSISQDTKGIDKVLLEGVGNVLAKSSRDARRGASGTNTNKNPDEQASMEMVPNQILLEYFNVWV